ncbi:hypothetical protein [Delftia acidovorans]
MHHVTLTAMAKAARQTIRNELLGQVSDYLLKNTDVDVFTMKSLKRSADKLAAIDAIQGSLVKSAIAALEWNVEDAVYWAKNVVALSDTADSYYNAAVTLRAVNDYENAAVFARGIFERAPHNSDFAYASAEMQESAGFINDAHKIFESIKDSSEKAQKDFVISSHRLKAMKDLAVTEERVRVDLKMACVLAYEKRVRINSIAHCYEFDPDGSSGCYFVLVKIPGNIEKVLNLEEALAIQLCEQPDWNPSRLSIEFTTENEHVMQTP